MKEDVELISLNSMTKRQIFSLCGKLVGHYPVARWLRVASSFVKRGCQGDAWDSFADRVAIERLKEVLTRLKADDPVKGVWSVSPTVLQTYGVMLVKLLTALLWKEATKLSKTKPGYEKLMMALT